MNVYHFRYILSIVNSKADIAKLNERIAGVRQKDDKKAAVTAVVGTKNVKVYWHVIQADSSKFNVH